MVTARGHCVPLPTVVSHGPPTATAPTHAQAASVAVLCLSEAGRLECSEVFPDTNCGPRWVLLFQCFPLG